ncbi:MAG: DUF1624 domain-containing protein [Rhizobiaceae bacterium]|nr:DUF1624 domain-containing protein [Rhizobiaceae bacterium]
MNDLPTSGQRPPRVAAIDVARGAALLAMAIYHFAWDLEFFGYVPAAMTAEGGWKLFARSIAGSFLFLVGVSLVLAHGKSIRWDVFAKRLAMVACAALAITAATLWFTPDNYIFFGILHSIVVSSLLGLFFLRVPPLLTLAIGLAIILSRPYLLNQMFNHDGLLWLGLSTVPAHSNDFVPLFPWFGPVLLGIATGKIGVQFALIDRLASLYRGADIVGRSLSLAGRHSLAVYLIHQPMLIGTVYLASMIIPAPPSDPIAEFSGSCVRTCVKENEANFCSRFCQCTLNELVDRELLGTLMTQGQLGKPVEGVQEIVQSCTVSSLPRAD